MVLGKIGLKHMPYKGGSISTIFTYDLACLWSEHLSCSSSLGFPLGLLLSRWPGGNGGLLTSHPLLHSTPYSGASSINLKKKNPAGSV